ncbi:MAG: hypothetical protein PHR00_00665 [Patescibacteria group bacterium]|nr:hypothetical protein [Patescibacteria group bacterium]
MGRFTREARRQKRNSRQALKKELFSIPQSEKHLEVDYGHENESRQKTTANVDSQKNQSFNDSWQEYLKHCLPKKINSLTFRYEGFMGNHQKRDIAEALVLWEFIRNKFRPTSYSLSYKKELISQLETDSSNSYINKVLTIESLPTTVWRKLLWKENINFDSYEACLRRMSEKQLCAIQDNFNDFSCRKIPRVFTWFDKVFRGVSYEKLSYEATSDKRRYVSKGSMSYNLLGLDFGFNAYPNGENDDYKIIEFSPLRFLSVKNHADDFVVNQEDGKYWKMYRLARSNYAFRPNRKVELKDHICPGFWYTFLIHLLFWIISPILAANGIYQLSENSWPEIDVFTKISLLPGLLTPLWLTMAILKILGNIILEAGKLLLRALEKMFATKIFTEAIRRVKNWPSRHKEFLKGVGIGTLIASVILIIRYILIPYAYSWLGFGGVIWLVWIIFYNLITFSPNQKENPLYRIDFDYLPKGSKSISRLLRYGGLGLIVYEFREKIWHVLVTIGLFVGEVISFCWQIIVNFVSASILPLSLLAIILVPLVIYYLWLKHKVKEPTTKTRRLTKIKKEINNNKLETCYKIFEKLILITTSLLILLLFGIYFYYLSKTEDALLNMVVLSCLIILTIIMSLVLSRNTKKSFYKINPKTSIYYNGFSEMDLFSLDLIKLIKTNKWLIELDSIKKAEVIEDIKEIADRITGFVYNKYYRQQLSRLIVSNLNENNYTELKRLKLVNRCNDNGFYDLHYNLREHVVKLILGGMSLQKAIKKATQEAEKLAKKEENIKTSFLLILKIIFSPVILLVKLAKYAVTLKRLYELFNKRCPYIAKSKVLD